MSGKSRHADVRPGRGSERDGQGQGGPDRASEARQEVDAGSARPTDARTEGSAEIMREARRSRRARVGARRPPLARDAGDRRANGVVIQTAQLTDPAVRAFVSAVNAGDRDAFRAVLTPDATMSDDGSDRDLHAWAEREIFSASVGWTSCRKPRRACPCRGLPQRHLGSDAHRLAVHRLDGRSHQPLRGPPGLRGTRRGRSGNRASRQAGQRSGHQGRSGVRQHQSPCGARRGGHQGFRGHQGSRNSGRGGRPADGVGVSGP